MNTKKILIISGVVALVFILIGVCFWYVMRQNSSSSIGGQTTTTTSSGGGQASVTSTPPPVLLPPTQTSTDDLFSLPTPRGVVVVKNFYKNAVIVSSDGSALLARTPAYDITYFRPDQSFHIAIEETPVADARAQAETAFLKLMGINPIDACKLTVTEGVPIGVDQRFAGVVWGLSFCK